MINPVDAEIVDHVIGVYRQLTDKGYDPQVAALLTVAALVKDLESTVYAVAPGPSE